jgi:hypothetical protein
MAGRHMDARFEFELCKFEGGDESDEMTSHLNSSGLSSTLKQRLWCIGRVRSGRRHERIGGSAFSEIESGEFRWLAFFIDLCGKL